MDKFTSVPEIDGLFWYFENGVTEPRPVMINHAKWGKKFKSFNGAEQSWLREGEYLVGPQPAPPALARSPHRPPSNEENIMPAEIMNLFVMNAHGHYFEVNVQEVTVDKALLGECLLFDSEPALLEAVCCETGCELDEVAGSTYYITLRNGAHTLIDDRGFAHAVEGPVEAFIADYVM